MQSIARQWVKGSCNITSGSCKVTPSSPGVKTLVAHYNGDANDAPSDSAGTTHTITGTTSLVITTNLSTPTSVGTVYSVAVHITFTAVDGYKPTGSVYILSAGGCTIHLEESNNGNGSCVIGPNGTGFVRPRVGKYRHLGIYVGDTNFARSIAPAVPHTVN